MQQTRLTLSEHYKKYKRDAKNQGFLWLVYPLIRNAESDMIYKKIEENWSSLDDITGDTILFVFSAPGTMYFRDNVTSEFHPRHYRNGLVNFAELNSRAVSEMANDFAIPESKIPCLLFINLQTDRMTVLPLYNDDSNIVFIFKELRKQLQEDNLLNEYRIVADRVQRDYRNENAFYDRMITVANQINISIKRDGRNPMMLRYMNTINPGKVYIDDMVKNKAFDEFFDFYYSIGKGRDIPNIERILRCVDFERKYPEFLELREEKERLMSIIEHKVGLISCMDVRKISEQYRTEVDATYKVMEQLKVLTEEFSKSQSGLNDKEKQLLELYESINKVELKKCLDNKTSIPKRILETVGNISNLISVAQFATSPQVVACCQSFCGNIIKLASMII